MKSKFISAFICSIVLAGCLGKEEPIATDQMPQGAASPNLELHPIAIDSVSSAPNRAFLTALQRAYQNDPNLIGARIRTQLLEQSAQSLANPLRPELSLQASTIGDSNPALVATMPVIDFGKRNARVAQIVAQQGTSTIDQAELREAILRSALQTVLVHDFATRRMALHRKQISDAIEALATTDRLMALNLVTAADGRLAEVARQEAEINLTRAQIEANEAQRDWEQIFAPVVLPRSLNILSLRRETGLSDLSAALEAASSHNLRLRRLQAASIELAADANNLQRRNTPTINLRVQGVLDDTRDSLDAGLTLDFPLFQSDTANDVAQVEGRARAITAERNASLRDLRFELQGYDTKAQSARALARNQNASLSLLNQRIDDVAFQVETGLATFTDLLDARKAAYDAELAELESLFEANLADMETIILTGKLVP
jgi:outer membrane protein TolC